MLEGRRDAVRRRGRGRRGRARRRPRSRRSTPRSTAGSGTPAGPTSSPRSPAAPTRSPGRTSTSRCPSRPASSRVLAPQESCLLGLVSRARPGASSPATPAWSSPRERRPLPAVTLAEVLATSDVPGGVVNVLTGFAGRARAVAGRHMDVNAIDLTGVDRAERAEPWRARRPTTSSGSSRPRTRTGSREPGHGPADRVPRDQDRLAPDRRLTAR